MTNPVVNQHLPAPSSPTPDSDGDQFHDVQETLTSSDLSTSTPPPPIIPNCYSVIEPPPSPISSTESELSIFRLVKEICGSVKPGSDVTNINLPASILDPVSTLEKAKKSMQRGELLQDICSSPDEQSRLLNVLRFNFSGLAKERFGKKPYNPVLGEVYRCCFVHRAAAGETLLVAEQVSHHPPITALHLQNDTLGFYMDSYTAPEPRFWGNSLEVKLAGEIRLVLSKFDNEEYIITRPYINMSGFLAGKQRLEFNGTSTFMCKKSGLGAEVEFKARGALGVRNDINAVTGEIFMIEDRQVLYTLEGYWDQKVMITDVQTNQQKVLFDYEAVRATKSMTAVLPTPEQEEDSFSTKVWAECSKAIISGDSSGANVEKRRVEDCQRRLKRERVAAGAEWRCHYFRNRRDGAAGYELRDEIARSTNLVRLGLSSKDLEGFRSGELLKTLQAKVDKEAELLERPDAKKNGLSKRLSILSRSRTARS